MRQVQLVFNIKDDVQTEYVANILRHVAYKIERNLLNGGIYNGEGEIIGTYTIVKTSPVV